MCGPLYFVHQAPRSRRESVDPCDAACSNPIMLYSTSLERRRRAWRRLALIITTAGILSALWSCNQERALAKSKVAHLQAVLDRLEQECPAASSDDFVYFHDL